MASKCTTQTAGEDGSENTKNGFGDCALIEIIHLHDCLRGALKELQKDVTYLSRSVADNQSTNPLSSSFFSRIKDINELEGRVAGRFKVIWSVFKAHSSAEDEFIWPALKNKLSRQKGSNNAVVAEEPNNVTGVVRRNKEAEKVVQNPIGKVEASLSESPTAPSRGGAKVNLTDSIHQEEYEEDHEEEEKLFSTMNDLLEQLRAGLKNETAQQQVSVDVAQNVKRHVDLLSQHLLQHLAKEESQCMPLVKKHLSKDEINDLVGKIMGKRSSDIMGQILSLAVRNLPPTEREEMVLYMKQAMIGTFFEKWLIMGGWSGSNLSPELSAIVSPIEKVEDRKPSAEEKRIRELGNVADTTNSDASVHLSDTTARTDQCISEANRPDGKITQEELQKLIRAIAANPQLTTAQKNTTIQGLRDSVWKSNRKRNLEAMEGGSSNTNLVQTHESQTIMRKPASSRATRITPPSFYLKRVDSDIKIVWSSDTMGEGLVGDQSVPLFSASELAPTYHDGATAAVLGCPHYARACKLMHPSSGRLYTCRLCCEQERTRHIPDAPLDRYAVTEVLCMRCGSLQPADDRCNNPQCESQGKAYASYTCSICNLYENSTSKSIYHCPYCNVCRTGKGLGIDYRHCMRCNSCVSLADDKHVCIPQSLQGHCPICHEMLFESTAPLRRLKCGHVMHLSCFTQYMRGHTYTCPLCKKSIEDMGTYWEKLDAAIRMQPMPEAYANTQSAIYCQDCGKSGKVKYHFVGLKCGNCGSYNTRETERIER